jgi:hypothetical protein
MGGRTDDQVLAGQGQRVGHGPGTVRRGAVPLEEVQKGGQMDRRPYGPVWAVLAILVVTTILVLAIKL